MTTEELLAEGYGARREGRAVESRAMFLRAAEIFRADGDQAQLAYALRHLGDVLRKCGAMDEAAACSVEALGMYREGMGTKLDIANTLRGLAMAREPDATRELWVESRDIYAELGIEPGVAECNRHLA